MSLAFFLVFFAAGSGALALWTDVRFEKRRPADLRNALLHIGLAWCIAQFLAGPAMEAVAGAGHPLEAVIVVGLPTIVYCLLSVLWLMRLASGLLRSRFQ